MFDKLSFDCNRREGTYGVRQARAHRQINGRYMALSRLVSIAAIALALGSLATVDNRGRLQFAVSSAADKTAVPARSDVTADAPQARALTAGDERTLRPKDHFVECDGCPEMIVIPAGSFHMGSYKDKDDGDSDEHGPGGTPIKVTITSAYALGRFVITVKDYMRCVAEAACPPPAWREQGNARESISADANHFKRLGDALTNPRHPIVGVNWHNARAFLAWLNAKLQLSAARGYRLPSEAEWEAAARGGREGLKYSWGNEFSASSANATGEAGDDKWEYTSPVGSFPANPYGLYDMHGNVWEWVEDCYHLSYTSMPEVVTNTGAAWTSQCDEADRKVLRGGSWIDSPRVLRSADRGGSPPDMRYSYVGFRVARTLLP
jgi:formylglycine-generating enzyme required for sulfatase activity